MRAIYRMNPRIMVAVFVVIVIAVLVSERRDSKELTAYADKKFSEISLEPKVLLSPQAKAFNLSFTCIGEGLEMYKKQFAEKNWLGVMKKDKYDNKHSIDSYVEYLKSKEFQLLVKINPASLPERRLCYLPLSTSVDSDVKWWGSVQSDADWEKHPDGTGLIHPWRPDQREVMIFLSDSRYGGRLEGDVRLAETELENQFRIKAEKLCRKKELGDLDEAGFNEEICKLKAQKRKEYLALLNKF